jgi:type I restriction enzyme M protein
VIQKEQQFLNDLDKKLWNANVSLHSNINVTGYKHVKLGPIFLKYVSDTFTERYEVLLTSFKASKNDCCLDDEAEEAAA